MIHHFAEDRLDDPQGPLRVPGPYFANLWLTTQIVSLVWAEQEQQHPAVAADDTHCSTDSNYQGLNTRPQLGGDTLSN